MNHLTITKHSDRLLTNGNTMYTPTYGIYRHDQWQCEGQFYRVTCKNWELAYMQGGTPHFNCVVDDFGTLVRVK